MSVPEEVPEVPEVPGARAAFRPGSPRISRGPGVWKARCPNEYPEARLRH